VDLKKNRKINESDSKLQVEQNYQADVGNDVQG